MFIFSFWRVCRCHLVLLFFLLGNLLGCAEAPLREWGSEVRIAPGWEKFKRAAVKAAKDPGTWVPAAGAALVLASGRDDELTQDLISDNPVYGSREDALQISDEHSITLNSLWIASMMFTTSDDEHWLADKTRGIVAETLMVNTSLVLTNSLKKAIRRREPYEGLTHVEYEAFPSNHSTPQFTQVALIRRNLRYSRFNDVAKYSIISGAYLLASSSAYGRVEGGLHSVSDQLAGAALGNYIGAVLYDTFFEDETSWTMALSPTRDNQGARAQFAFAF